MKNQKTNLCILVFLFHFGLFSQSTKIISRQGKVTFFSYTSVENIEATNNQVLSIINTQNGDIAVQLLMRAFVFKKALMEEHFNESYVESDTYPKLTFSGKIEDFNVETQNSGPMFIKGLMDFHGVQKEIEVKTTVREENNTLVLDGTFDVAIDDFNISVPTLLVPNISKKIEVRFRFEYIPYED